MERHKLAGGAKENGALAVPRCRPSRPCLEPLSCTRKIVQLSAAKARLLAHRHDFLSDHVRDAAGISISLFFLPAL